jgi:hypothetical protein
MFGSFTLASVVNQLLPATQGVAGETAALPGAASAALSPNIYVTGGARSTNGVFCERSMPVVTVLSFATALMAGYNCKDAEKDS